MKKQQHIDITIFPLIKSEYKDKSFRKTKYLFFIVNNLFQASDKNNQFPAFKKEKKR